MALDIMMQFSKQEIKDIVVAVVFLTVIFSFSPLPNLGLNLSLVPTAFVVVVTAFLFHELAHKYMGIRYGCDAYFKLWPEGLFLGLVTMLLPFIKFVAPGATVINPHKHGRWMFQQARLNLTEMGMISAAGPLVNITISLLFLPFSQIPFFGTLCYINAWLAFFNLLPVPPLDGSKVMMWHNWIWMIMIVISGGIAFFA